MKCQLWSQDEYGMGSIIGTFDSPELALKKAESEVTNHNFENALTSREQIGAFEAYLVHLEDGMYYGGNRPDGKHRYYDKNGKINLLSNKNNCSIYIGSRFEKNASGKNSSNKESKIYLQERKEKKPVSNVEDKSLEGKTIYYIRFS